MAVLRSSSMSTGPVTHNDLEIILENDYVKDKMYDCAKYSSRQCPILQDTNFNVAYILSCSRGMADEEIVNLLVDNVATQTLRHTRSDLFKSAAALLREQTEELMDNDCLIPKLKVRRGQNAAGALALDCLVLFKYASGITHDFPARVVQAQLRQLWHPVDVNNALPKDLTDSNPANVNAHDTHVTSAKDTPSSHTHEASPDEVVDNAHHSTSRTHSGDTPSDQHIDHESDSISLSRQTYTDTSFMSLPPIFKSDTPAPTMTSSPRAKHRCPVTNDTLESININTQPPSSPYNPTDIRAHVTPPPSISDVDVNVPENYLYWTTDRLLADVYALKNTMIGLMERIEQIEKDPNSKIPSPQITPDPLPNADILGDISDTFNNVHRYIEDMQRDIMSNTEDVQNLKYAVSSQPALPAQPAPPVRPAQPAPPARPAQPAQPARLARPVQPPQPSNKSHRRVEKSAAHAEHGRKTAQKRYAQVPTVPCSNRFSALTPDDPAALIDDDADDKAEVPFTKVPSRKNKPKPPHNKSPKVTVVGSSMVRDLGSLLQSRGMDACSYTNPGCRAEHIRPRIESMTSDADDFIILAGGTNNIPSEGAADAILDIGKTIDHTRRMRPNSQIIIPQVLYRYDETNHQKLNQKIDRVNVFLQHKCMKDPSLHFLKLDDIRREDYVDGLHLDLSGKTKYADAILSSATNITRT